MNKKNVKLSFKRILAMVCAALVAVAFLASVILPAALAVTQQQLDAADKKTQQAKEDMDEAEEKRLAAVSEYNALDQQINETEQEITILETQIEQTKEDILKKEEELKQAEAEFEEYKALFLKRARIMYENSAIDYLEILFGAENFSDFLSKIEMITQLMKYDRDIIDKMEKTKQRIADTKTELEETLKRQEESALTLEERKTSLDNALAKKQLMINELQNDVERYKAIYEAAEEAEAALIREHRNALSYSSNPVKYTGGKFAWPVPGSQRITSYYGWRIHPVYKTRKFHTGIDIGAGYGLDIVAAADGVVTLATTNGGYGKCVIINHGSGITSLYGHCSTLLVSVGDKVVKGEVIAKVGSTGVSTGPHLHFEVRENSSTTDPLGYLR